MRLTAMPKRIRPGRVAAVLCAGVAAAGLAAAPAQAIIGGQIDGTAHPYVAAIGQPDGAGIVFSGVAVSPTVVLTAVHAVHRLEDLGFTTARVTFDPVATGSSTWYVGTIHEDPAYDPASAANPNDLAVIVLAAPVPDLSVASLPTNGQLDQLVNANPSRPSFSVVGYGISGYTGGANGGGTPTPDLSTTGTRKAAHGYYFSSTAAWLRLTLQQDADVCIGDSGGPAIIDGTTTVLGILHGNTSLSGDQCTSQPWLMRVDTSDARTFLGSYGVPLP